ncbi:MAG: patatin-like phospholipase family protein [Inquilinus sp.]|nr:patatin-like phospholipase family protein [Inquilinus sp.]
MGHRRLASVLLCVMALTACASGDKRPDGIACPTTDILYPVNADIGATVDTRAMTRGARTFADALTDTMVQPDAVRIARPERRSLLTLSGGGQWGAYGAGFLNGWTTYGPRPPFDVVTGVSTGALIAPFAFLGPDFDGVIEQAYTIDKESDLVRERGFWAIFGNAFLDRSGLEALVSSVVADTGLLDKLRSAGPGRGLFIGIVDADSGAFFVVDLLALARSDRISEEERESCFKAYLLASTSVPAAFPPVFIDDRDGPRDKPRMFVDGGARQTVFYEDIETSVARMIDADANADLYVVINGDLRVPEVHTGNNLLGIALRASNIVVDQVSLTSLDRLVQRGRGEGWTVRYTTARGHGCDEAAKESKGSHFNPAFMRCLLEYGEQRWTTQTPWDR